MLYTFEAHARLADDLSPLTDEQLMLAVQQESSPALEELHRRHAPTLKAVIVRVLHNEH